MALCGAEIPLGVKSHILYRYSVGLFIGNIHKDVFQKKRKEKKSRRGDVGKQFKVKQHHKTIKSPIYFSRNMFGLARAVKKKMCRGRPPTQ
jgi:hypothetical protein